MLQLRNFSAAILSLFILITACSNETDQSQKVDQNNSNSGSNPSAAKISNQKLIKASLDGEIKTVQKAAQQGVPLNRQGQAGRTPLMMAAYNGHADIVEYLLEKKADPNTKDSRGRTPLIFAASGPYPKTVELLLENEANPNTTDNKEGWSALMWGAAEGNSEVVQVLLDHGADPTITDKDDETARDFATNNGHSKTGQLLKQAENK